MDRIIIVCTMSMEFYSLGIGLIAQSLHTYRDFSAGNTHSKIDMYLLGCNLHGVLMRPNKCN